jgi:hypothetical protein
MLVRCTPPPPPTKTWEREQAPSTKEKKDNLSNSDETETERDKEVERKAWAKKKKELQDKNISHYLPSTIFLIPRLSIHLGPSVSIEMCPRHQQAAHTLCPYKAIPLRGRLQSWWVG